MSPREPRMRVRLYHYWRSSSSWRVRWGFALKVLPCEFVSIDLLTDDSDSPEHLQRNPLGFVPALEFLTDSPTFRYLCESMAILEWLEETLPHPSLLPGDALQRARIRQLAEIINAGTQPLQNPNVALYHSSQKDEQKKWNAHWIRKGLHAYETLVQETAQTFSVGNTLTLSDLFLIPQCYNALRHDVHLSEFPRIERIYKAAMATPSCQASAPEKFNPN